MIAAETVCNLEGGCNQEQCTLPIVHLWVYFYSPNKYQNVFKQHELIFVCIKRSFHSVTLKFRAISPEDEDRYGPQNVGKF